MNSDDIKNKIKEWCDVVEQRLDELTQCDETSPYFDIYPPVRYSLLKAGKRIRPMLALEFCAACGGNPLDALDCACAIEMIHSYSLIHDDLPCMDNDNMRRGKPSCHMAYGEATALLAGDALQAFAAEAIANCTSAPADRLLRVSGELFSLAGAQGMVGGQMIDIESEGRAVGEDVLCALVMGKTCALIESACVAGCIIAGAAEDIIFAARNYARGLGMAFQIVDDILDVIGNPELLGKPIASDEENDKSTFVSLLGLDGAKALAQKYTDDAVKSLDILGEKGDFLKSFAAYLLERVN